MKRKGKSILWYCWLDGEKYVHLISPKLGVETVSWFSLEASPLLTQTELAHGKSSKKAPAKECL